MSHEIYSCGFILRIAITEDQIISNEWTTLQYCKRSQVIKENPMITYAYSKPKEGNITNATDSKPISTRSFLDIQLLQIIVFSLILTLSVFGNLMIVAIVKRNAYSQMKTSHNYLLVSLSVSNLLISVSCIPVYLVSAIYGPYEWKVSGILGLLLCKTGSFIADQAIAASSLTTVMISFDWFLGVFQPLKKHLNRSFARLGLYLSWIVSTIFAGPILYKAQILTPPREAVQMCTKGVLFDKEWVYTKIVLTGVIPLVLVMTLNTAVILKLWCHKFPGNAVPKRQRKITQRVNRKGFKLPLAIILMFYFCFFPYWIDFVGTFMFGYVRFHKNFVFRVIAVLLAYSNSAVSPCLLLCLGTRYRRGFFSIVRSFQCCNRPFNVFCSRVAHTLNRRRKRRFTVYAF